MQPDHTYTYGVGRILTYKSDGRTTWRYDSFEPLPSVQGPCGEDLVMVLGLQDRSPIHTTYPRGYDGRCSCCYLNIPHSRDLHLQRVVAHLAVCNQLICQENCNV